MYFGRLSTVSQKECGSYSLVPVRCVRDPRQHCKKGNQAGSGLFCIQGLFPLCCFSKYLVWCAIHFNICFPKLSGSFKIQCFVRKPVLQAFCSLLCFKSWWILLFYLSYDSFFSGRFIQTSLSNSSACVSIFCCKLLYCSWISSDLLSNLGFLPLFGELLA